MPKPKQGPWIYHNEEWLFIPDLIDRFIHLEEQVAKLNKVCSEHTS